jgi:hypothetical protein
VRTQRVTDESALTPRTAASQQTDVAIVDRPTAAAAAGTAATAAAAAATAAAAAATASHLYEQYATRCMLH